MISQGKRSSASRSIRVTLPSQREQPAQIVALFASLLVALTLTPVLCALLLPSEPTP